MSEKDKVGIIPSVVESVHKIDIGVKLVVGIAAVVGALTAPILHIYEQIGFGLSLAVSLLLVLVLTQLPLIVPWGRKHFVMWHSRNPWVAVLIAIPIVLLVDATEYLPYVPNQNSYSQEIKPPPSPPSTKSISEGSIEWDNGMGFAQTGDARGPIFIALSATGTNVGAAEVEITDAYIVSGITGARAEMKIETPEGKIPPLQTNPIPPGARITLWANITPGLHAKDLLEQWGKISFTVVYEGKSYVRVFSENYMRSWIEKFPDLMRGVHATKRQ